MTTTRNDNGAVLANGVAVVIGATGGIGLSLCKQLVLRGTLVLAVCRAQATAALRALQDVGVDDGTEGLMTLVENVDLLATTPGSVAAHIVRALDGRRIKLLACCAGKGSHETVDDVTNMTAGAADDGDAVDNSDTYNTEDATTRWYTDAERLYRLHCLAPLALSVALAQSGAFTAPGHNEADAASAASTCLLYTSPSPRDRG